MTGGSNGLRSSDDEEARATYKHTITRKILMSPIHVEKISRFPLK